MTELDPQKHTGLYKFFLVINRSLLPLILLNTLLYGLGTFWSVKMTVYVGKVIDALSSNVSKLHQEINLLILALILHEVAYRLGHIAEVNIHSRINAKTKKALFEYTSKLSFSYFTNRFAGQIAHQINTVGNTLQRMEEIIVSKFIDNTWMLIISSVALISIYKPLGFILGTWFIIYLLGVRILALKITKYAEDFAQQESSTTGILVDMYTNITAVKVYSKNFEKDHVMNQIESEYRSQLALGRWDIYTYAFQGFSAIILAVAFLLATAHGYQSGVISLGGIAIISGISLKILSFVYDTGHIISSFMRNRGECQQALKNLVVPISIIDGSDADHTWRTIGISYDNVSFSYQHNNKVLKSFSLTIPDGQKVGIVGLSGAGKTTMINLLLRFFDPQEGRILINKVDITSIRQEFLRSHISFIPQDTSLFHMTIEENIKYGLPHVSRESVLEAARVAYADDFIQKLPDGYHTMVGERGIKLSGGQRQRIAIARAILKKAPLFILDEATSSLDTESENYVQKGLKKLVDNKTAIIIAHRLSTLKLVDRIIYIENGKILEDGSHKELVKFNGKYAELFKKQTSVKL